MLLHGCCCASGSDSFFRNLLTREAFLFRNFFLSLLDNPRIWLLPLNANKTINIERTSA